METAGGTGGFMITVRPRVLCVDADVGILDLLEKMLISSGYEVVKAENGREALERIKAQNIDLVLSDIGMSKMDGLELCKKIKGDERFRTIPVILMTDPAAREERIKGIEAGAENFLSKPIDQTEVLTRMKMLLKVKVQNERRIGELLIEMNFITEAQLREALEVAKERKIKIGEALCSMGVLDKDQIYWALGNQLKMNYIELSSEMMDQGLVRRFSIDLLGELGCLPLYETEGEIHFALADPTNPRVVERVKSLEPEKVAHLHLAIPEKIREMLDSFKQDLLSRPRPKRVVPHERKDHPSTFDKTGFVHDTVKMEAVWSDFISVLLSMSAGETYWFYKTAADGRLLAQGEGDYKTLSQYSEEACLFLQERFRQNMPSQPNGKKARLFLREKTTQREGAFRLWQIDCFDRQMVKFERVPAFSEEQFVQVYPQAAGLARGLRDLFGRHRCLLLGGQDRLLMKQCGYLALTGEGNVVDFPPVFFAEDEMEIYFPKAIQLSKDHFDRIHLFDHFGKGPTPPVFYESTPPEKDSGGRFLSGAFSGIYQNIILSLPFVSSEAMEKALSERLDWNSVFKPLFLDPDQLKSL
jgi:DNA-binding response OmpR family regulator